MTAGLARRRRRPAPRRPGACGQSRTRNSLAADVEDDGGAARTAPAKPQRLRNILVPAAAGLRTVDPLAQSLSRPPGPAAPGRRRSAITPPTSTRKTEVRRGVPRQQHRPLPRRSERQGGYRARRAAPHRVHPRRQGHAAIHATTDAFTGHVRRRWCTWRWCAWRARRRTGSGPGRLGGGVGRRPRRRIERPLVAL